MYKSGVYPYCLSPRTSVTFRRGHLCQHTHTDTGVHVQCHSCCCSALPSHCAGPCAQTRAHLQHLPGHTLPPHLPELSAHYSMMLWGSPVMLGSLQAPRSHPCPFLPQSFPFCYGMSVTCGRATTVPMVLAPLLSLHAGTPWVGACTGM